MIKSKLFFVGSLLLVMIVGCGSREDKAKQVQNESLKGVAAMEGIEQEKGPSYVEGEVLLKFKPDVNEDLHNQIIKEYNCSILSVIEQLNVYKVSIPEDKTVPEMVEMLNKDERIEYAEPNMIYKVQ